MTSPLQLEILDLRHFNARQMRPLLEQQARAWLQLLRWDYRSSTEVLLQYLDSHILPGFVATSRGRICGYTFWVHEAQKAVIGDLYVSEDQPEPATVTSILARHLMEVLEAAPDLDRIEAQLLLFDRGALSSVFSGSSFQVFPRVFMERLLDQDNEARNDALLARLTPELELCSWNPSFYQAAAELIHAAYVGHIDSEINDQYRSLHGSLRFLHNIVRFPGCGTFDAQASWVLRDHRTHTLAALILCSTVAPNVAHVTQLCVAPAFRGRGLGKLLLDVCMQHIINQGNRALTLTVSEANLAALHLYIASGFQTRHRFDALVLDKGNRAQRYRLEHDAANDVPGESGGLVFASKRATPTRR